LGDRGYPGGSHFDLLQLEAALPWRGQIRVCIGLKFVTAGVSSVIGRKSLSYNQDRGMRVNDRRKTC
jgi:hypothetical protein